MTELIGDPVASFAKQYPFDFDDFQIDALKAMERGESVLVAAPTGSGKTVVGEFAVWLALHRGGKAFYTTPLKALSNQKFADLQVLHGEASVGLLTGDNSINGHAPVVVMTTEVLRNMIYERSDLLDDLHYVVLDEVHYLQDRYRGAVWEEVIIHLPMDVRIASLSATVSNAEEFAAWIETLRGPTTAVIEERRPVKLEQHYFISGQLHAMFVGSGGEMRTGGEVAPNPAIRKVEARASIRGSRRGRETRGARGPARYKPPRRSELVEVLTEEDLLPAIYFIFSRKGCDAAVQQCVREGLRLTDGDAKRQIRDFAEQAVASLDPSDLEVLGYETWLAGLTSGFAAHHAGLVPVFKETVEELFRRGLIGVVFATETLSLGINMPARTVVIESLSKFTGERHEILTAGQFTQLTGRAGRRGLDDVGHSVVPQQREMTFEQLAGLASTRTYPLVSSFQPSYNMATNLVRNYSREDAEHLLNSSFAQYHADKDVVVLERTIERNEAYIASYREKMICDRGDFAQYFALKEKVASLERSISRWEATVGRGQTRGVLLMARVGHIYMLTKGRHRGPVAVVGVERSKSGDPRVIAVTPERKVVRLTSSDFSRAPAVVGRVPSLADDFSDERGPGRSRDHEVRKRVAEHLRNLDVDDFGNERPNTATPQDAELEEAMRLLEEHPCSSCPDRSRHEHLANRAARLMRDNEGLRKRVRSRTETLSRRFAKVLAVLNEYGYIDGFSLTDKGVSLARVYNENDLLVTEVLQRGWLNQLEAAEVASVVSTFVYESRGPVEIIATLPTSASRSVYSKILKLSEKIKKSEAKAGLDLMRGTESGFVDTVYRWCRGASLDEVVGDDATPGDFIRSCKQTVDLLRQLREVAQSDSLRVALDDAVDGIHRGVVAYAGAV